MSANIPSADSSSQPWAGRFVEPLADDALAFSRSIEVDGLLFREDIAGSLAHVEMLAACGVIGGDEAAEISRGLVEIREEIERGDIRFDAKMEDIHMAIEARLIEKIGPVGGKLHTGRSRNDQVALDERLYLRAKIVGLSDAVRDLQRALVRKAREYNGVTMPGYTHLQRAQPILLSHHLLAYVEMLDRDFGRLADAAARMNLSPLGAAALAGTSFPLDRHMVASSLGFDGIVANSIDAVSDRDYLIELASACSIVMMHLSRLAEEMVIWSTREFGFVTIGDAYSTGSSIMPQKKNPDMAELVRGKTGRVYGDLMNLLTLMKGLPLAYNRDMQEDKAPIFDAVGTTLTSLGIMARMLDSTTFNRERMAAALDEDYLAATELADYLVRKGIPFRDAHAIVGRIVAYCDHHQARLHDLDLPTLRTFSESIESDLLDILEPARSVHMKRTAGSSAPSEVDAQLAKWQKILGL